MSEGILLTRLIDELPVTGEVRDDLRVTGIAHDSRRVEPGDLFVAIVGESFDGREFAAQAAEKGAVAVLSSGAEPGPARATRVPWLPTPEPREILGELASRVYRAPDRELLMAGVTGTNGKSTVTHVVASLLEAAGKPTGIVGSLGYRFAGHEYPAGRTTPEASDLLKYLRAMRDAGAEAVSMEVSSHALVLGRVATVTYDVAGFTNLSRDHLDFHPSLEDYFQAKRRLFEKLKPGGRAAVNLDDEHGARLARELPDVVTYGEGGDVRALEIELDTAGIHGRFATPEGELEVDSPLLGAFNVANLLTAVAMGHALGLGNDAIERGLAEQQPVPGRMEPVDRGQPFPVYIDYSHTDGALEAALSAIREFAGKKIIVVFGCGGDRDTGKRPLMGRVAGQLAELPIVTSDNPRTEDPLEIIAAVEEGLKVSGNTRYRMVPDRREAIRRAIALAGPEWVVLVAGKGSEAYQIVGEEETPFYDREEVEKALEERFGA